MIYHCERCNVDGYGETCWSCGRNDRFEDKVFLATMPPDSGTHRNKPTVDSP